jgi:hypothetical protein
MGGTGANMKRTIDIMVLLLAVSVFSFGQEKEQVIALLYEIDENRTKYGDEIIHIEEFNFGIPGGVTGWLNGRIKGTYSRLCMPLTLIHGK